MKSVQLLSNLFLCLVRYYISMFTKWIPGMAKEPGLAKTTTASPISPEQLKFILETIQNHLSEELGEKIEPQLSQSETLRQKLAQPVAINQPNNQNPLQSQLLSTKQRYNNLVNQLDTHNEYMKQILSHIIEMLIAIGQTLDNQDLLTPIQQFQTSFQNLNVNKVQKHLKYFEKLFEAALDDLITKKTKAVEKELNDEMAVIKNYSKEIQGLYRKEKSKTEQLEQKVNKINTSNQELNEKIKILEQLSSEHTIQSLSKETEKFKQKQNEYMSQIKNLERDKTRLQKSLKEIEKQLMKRNSALQTIKKNQSTMFEQLSAESRKKQQTFNQSISKHYHQKLLLQQKIELLQNQLEIQKIQNRETAKQISNQKQESNLHQISDLRNNITELQERNRHLENQNKDAVNREILKELFVKYDDQGKQWAIRKNIQNQIYLLLGISKKKDEISMDNNAGQVKTWFSKLF